MFEKLPSGVSTCVTDWLYYTFLVSASSDTFQILFA